MAKKEDKDIKTERGNRKPSSQLKEWWRRSYWRELSVVVIGILITFQGSAWIERSSQRREAVKILEMVRDELHKNIRTLDTMKERLGIEFTTTAALAPYADDPKSIPPEILNEYFPPLSWIRSFNVHSNSFETLKASSQIQAVKSKELLSSLFAIYETTYSVVGSVTGYYSRKSASTSDFFDSLSIEMIRATERGEFLPVFILFMENNSARNYLLNSARGNQFFLIPNIDEAREETLEVIDMIDREVKGRRKSRTAQSSSNTPENGPGVENEGEDAVNTEDQNNSDNV